MVLVIALLNDGTVMTISVDRVKPSLEPNSWDLREVFVYGITYGLWLALSTIVMLYVMLKARPPWASGGSHLLSRARTDRVLPAIRPRVDVKRQRLPRPYGALYLAIAASSCSFSHQIIYLQVRCLQARGEAPRLTHAYRSPSFHKPSSSSPARMASSYVPGLT
jgi:hypothetical protein